MLTIITVMRRGEFHFIERLIFEMVTFVMMKFVMSQKNSMIRIKITN